jgi:hypothetical protein
MSNASSFHNNLDSFSLIIRGEDIWEQNAEENIWTKEA